MPEPVDAALNALRLGLAVVPPREDGSKAPLGCWAEYQTRLPTESEVRSMYEGGLSGMGFVLGTVSGNVEMLDFDEMGIYEAFMRRAARCGLEALTGRIEAGYHERSPKPGRHWFWRCEPALRTQKLACRPATDEEMAAHPEQKVYTLIELKSTGGYGIVAPTNGKVHPNGGRYEALHGDWDSICEITPSERCDLLDLARSFDVHGATRAVQRAVRPPQGRPGDEWAARTSWETLVEGWGWPIVARSQGELYLRRPGKNQGISATVNYQGNDLLWVFTSSTDFEMGVSYTKFGAYALVEHGGDYGAAAKALAQLGFAKEIPSRAKRVDEGPARRLKLTRASEIKAQPVRWLWEERIALGALTLLGGRESTGKSTIAYGLVADVTNGLVPGALWGQPRNVIVCATEDAWDYTIKPRLVAARADCDRVFRVEVDETDAGQVQLSLPRDLDTLEEAITELDAAFTLLDPLLSRLSSELDTHKDAEVRLALEPLTAMAERTRSSFYGLIHVNKSGGTDPLTMLMASRAFPAVARGIFFAMRDVDEYGLLYYGIVKSNIGPDTWPAKRYRLEEQEVVADGHTLRVVQPTWLEDHTLTIREILMQSEQSYEVRSATSEAADWLEDYLQSVGGVSASAKVKEEGKRQGHSPDALKRAARKIGLTIETAKTVPRTTYWRLQSEQD